MFFTEELVDKMNIKIEKHYICYFDLLGYKEFIENNPTKHKTFLVNIEAIIGKVENIIIDNNNGFNIKYRTYSDNFLLFAKRFDNNDDSIMLDTLSRIMRKIQLCLLADFEIIIRGGITIGEFFADEKIVFGSGLVRAYELESLIAKMPRIVVDKELFEVNMDWLIQDECIALDYDNVAYINFFRSVESLKYSRGKIIKMVRTNCKYHYSVADNQKILQKEKVIEKYIWLLIKFNAQCENLHCIDLKIEYELRINERLMKTEVEVISNITKQRAM